MYQGYGLKDSVVVVYTGDGKGKTSASLGLMLRALGAGHKVAYVQFIKHWTVSEHHFITDIAKIYKRRLLFIKGGRGFYKAGASSAKGVSSDQHRQAAEKTFSKAYQAATSGHYDLVICDELSNACHDGLITKPALLKLLKERHRHTSLCITGRNFPKSFYQYTDIITEMNSIKHHFDNRFLANRGIDF